MNELKEWLKSRKSKPRNIKELSEEFKGVPYKTVAGWVYKNRMPVKKEFRKRLYCLTKIDKFMPDNLKEEKIKELENILLKLDEELEPLIQSEVLRHQFRKEFKKSDIIYLSSLLEALLDEKRFQLWYVFQKVKIKGE